MNDARHFYLKDIPNVAFHTCEDERLQNANARILLSAREALQSPDFDEAKVLLKQPINFKVRNSIIITCYK